jgi:hypothetical protein
MLDKFTKVLSDAPTDKTFKTGFGEIRNLSELRNLLVEKGKPFFESYVTESDNHFANWIDGVFEDSEFAQMLRNEKSYGATIKLVDSRINYAKLWLSFNAGKETLNRYLANSPFLQETDIPHMAYDPTFHKFETLSNMSFDGLNSIQSITKVVNPPKVDFLPPIGLNLNAEKKDIFTTEEIFNKSQPLQNSDELKHKKDPEVELLKQLENQFPGIKIAEPPRKKGFFEKAFGFIYQ